MTINFSRDSDMKRVDSTQSTVSATQPLQHADSTQGAHQPIWSPGPWNDMAANKFCLSISGLDGTTGGFQLCAEVASFQPKVDPLSYFHDNTVSDAPRTLPTGKAQVSDTASVSTDTSARLGPVGSVSARSMSPDSSSSRFFLGPEFSNERRDLKESRFLCLANMPISMWNNGCLDLYLRRAHIQGTLSNAMFVQATHTHGSVYASFSDLRTAAQAYGHFTLVVPDGVTYFISQYDYYTVDNSSPEALSINEYAGQVEFQVASNYRALKDDAELEDTVNFVLSQARRAGDLRSFTVLDNAPGLVKFRAEYFDLKDAENALSLRAHGITVIPYMADCHRRYSHPSVPSQVLAESISSRDSAPRSGRRQAFSPRPTQGRDFGVPSQRLHRVSNSSPVRQHWLNPNTRYAPGQNNNSYYQSQAYHDGSNNNNNNNRTSQSVSIRNIVTGMDVRTTIMIRNVPNRVTAEDLKWMLDDCCYGQHDFSYLRIDFQNNSNVGYAFVNFVRPEFIINFAKRWANRPWREFSSHKVCEISYATIQGVECLTNKFRNSSIMQEPAANTPKLWYTIDCFDIPTGKSVGEQRPFPRPDNMSKLARSIDNARTIGLFAPRGTQDFQHDQRSRSSQYDRGTTMAMNEEHAYDQAGGYSQSNNSPARLQTAQTHHGLGYLAGRNNTAGNHAQAPIGPPMVSFPQYNYTSAHPVGTASQGYSANMGANVTRQSAVYTHGPSHLSHIGGWQPESTLGPVFNTGGYHYHTGSGYQPRAFYGA